METESPFLPIKAQRLENRRGRKLIDGDQIIFANETYIVPNSDPLGRKLARSEN